MRLMVFAVLAVPSAVWAQSGCTAIAQNAAPMEYVSSFVAALHLAHSVAVDTEKPTADLAQRATGVLYYMKRRAGAARAAQSLMAPWTSSADSAVRESATLSEGGFRLLADADSMTVGDLRARLDGEVAAKPGTEADRISDLLILRRRGAEALIAAVGAFGEALLGPPSKNGRYEQLCITRRQRDELVSSIVRSFGNGLRPGAGGQFQSDYVPPAAALVKFLQSGWRLQPAPGGEGF